MQYYTHQQMAGGPRYTGKSLIGNWNEDFQQEDNLVREVLFKAQTGTLKLNQHSQKVNTHSEPVALSGGNSGAIRLGEPVEVVSLMTGSRCAKLRRGDLL